MIERSNGRGKWQRLYSGTDGRNDRKGEAFLGWCVTALVGGALTFRPMIWLLGDAGTGKTFLLSDVLKKLMGPLLTDVGSGSEAGLASIAGSASLPFCIDEFELEKGKEESITKMLNLMRIASGGDSARLRGTSTGGAIIRRPRFSLLVSSINKPSLDSASKSRVLNVRLSTTPVADWPKVRDAIYKSLSVERALAIRTCIIRNTPCVVRKAAGNRGQIDCQGRGYSYGQDAVSVDGRVLSIEWAAKRG